MRTPDSSEMIGNGSEKATDPVDYLKQFQSSENFLKVISPKNSKALDHRVVARKLSLIKRTGKLTSPKSQL